VSSAWLGFLVVAATPIRYNGYSPFQLYPFTDRFGYGSQYATAHFHSGWPSYSGAPCLRLPVLWSRRHWRWSVRGRSSQHCSPSSVDRDGTSYHRGSSV